MDEAAYSLFKEIKILEANKHYRFTDLILCRGIRWAQDRQIILEDERYKNTILRKYLERTHNIHLKKPPRLRDLHEIIYQHAFENNYKRPGVNSLTLPVRLGDITEEKERFDQSIRLYKNLHRNIKKLEIPTPKTIYIVSALHYGANEINGKYFFSEDSYRKNYELFEIIYKQLSKLNSKIVLVSSRDIDKDICFISRSHYIYPSQSRMTELILSAHNSFLCNPTKKDVFASHRKSEQEATFTQVKRKSQGLKKFKNAHCGERVILVCNGPSLNKTNFDLIKNERIIALNKIHLGLERFGFTPDYLVAINKIVIQQSINEMIKINCKKFIMGQENVDWSENKDIFPIQRIDGPRAGKRDDGFNFSTDLSKGFVGGKTVTYAALQIAYYMGFTKVIIVGMDHNFSCDGKANQEGLLIGEDTNHFDPSYFGNMLWQNPDLKASEDAYNCAKDFYERRKMQIIDSTVDGNCTIFEKQDLSTALSLPTPPPTMKRRIDSRIRSFFRNFN